MAEVRPNGDVGCSRPRHPRRHCAGLPQCRLQRDLWTKGSMDPRTGSSCPRPSAATGGSTCSVSMSCNTWCWIAEALSFCFRFSPREETNAVAITSIESHRERQRLA
jgi:hypothetical protein